MLVFCGYDGAVRNAATRSALVGCRTAKKPPIGALQVLLSHAGPYVSQAHRLRYEALVAGQQAADACVVHRARRSCNRLGRCQLVVAASK
jgi:hypothetical protein